MTNKHDERVEITPQKLATIFHDTYEVLAPVYGYETRKETRDFDPESVNGKLMIAVCTFILETEIKPTITTITKEVREQTLAEAREGIIKERDKYPESHSGNERARFYLNEAIQLLDTLENKK